MTQPCSRSSRTVVRTSTLPALRPLDPEQRLHFVADRMNRSGLIFDNAAEVVRANSTPLSTEIERR